MQNLYTGNSIFIKYTFSYFLVFTGWHDIHCHMFLCNWPFFIYLTGWWRHICQLGGISLPVCGEDSRILSASCPNSEKNLSAGPKLASLSGKNKQTPTSFLKNIHLHLKTCLNTHFFLGPRTGIWVCIGDRGANCGCWCRCDAEWGKPFTVWHHLSCPPGTASTQFRKISTLLWLPVLLHAPMCHCWFSH